MKRTNITAIAVAAVAGALAAISAMVLLPGLESRSSGPSYLPHGLRITNVAAASTVEADPLKSRSAVPAKAPARITLGAYNVQNFFDTHNDPYNGDEVMTPKDEASLAKLAEVIAATDADFLGICEMEKMGALAEFVNDRLPDQNYKFVHVTERIGMRGINNGFLSRVRPGPITVHRFAQLKGPTGRTWPFARDLLHVQIQPDEGAATVHVFVVHLKSKRDGKNDPKSTKWRTAEAMAISKIVREMLAKNPSELIAVVGDFNDTPGSKPIDTLTAGGPIDGPLTPALAHLPDEQRITYLRPPFRSQIDYIMVSPALAKCYVPGSAKVVNVEGMIDASDHAPVVASFDVPIVGKVAQ